MPVYPKFKSKHRNPHPLFKDFIKASLKNAKKSTTPPQGVLHPGTL
jgi:CTP synthase (UTP-ammonia lyase)